MQITSGLPEDVRIHSGKLCRWPIFIAIFLLMPAAARADSRLRTIQHRGVIMCGVYPHVAGFAEIDLNGRYVGFDVDICRALSAAIFGTADRVRYVEITTMTEFRKSDIDVVSRRLSWELRREFPLGFLFGPVMFYDGQGFLVAKKLAAATPLQLSRVPLCVANGKFESNVRAYFQAKALTLVQVPLKSAEDFKDIRDALENGRCSAYSADVTELGAIRSGMPHFENFEILPQMISKEPLAQLVRQNDIQFFDILRWTVNALVYAEELGIGSSNLDEMMSSNDRSIQVFLGVISGNGMALGLPERWAYSVIKAVGNYGEIFERNVGRDSPIKLDRGYNRLWNNGGLMYAPPLR